MELKLQMEFIQSIRDGLDTGRQVLRRACYLQDQPGTCMCGREMHFFPLPTMHNGIIVCENDLAIAGARALFRTSNVYLWTNPRDKDNM